MRAPLCFFLTLLFGGCHPATTQPTLHVSAAISTAPALKEIARNFEKTARTTVIIDGEGSSTLARQIEQGGPADLFLSADEEWADYLAQHQLVAQQRDLLGNHLVVVVGKDESVQLRGLKDLANPGVKRIAVADKEVPAGRYARQTLTRAGLWDPLQEKLLQGGNVRATLMYVVRGEADAGLVYGTDASGVDTVRVAFTVPDQLHEPIRYPLVLLRRDSMRPAARELYDYLQSDAAGAVFRRFGFGFLP